MASYTMQLRKVINLYTRDEVEQWFKDYNLNDYLLPDQIETIEHSNLFNKDKLAKKIVDHYFMREIGFETPALFRHYAKTTMAEIMETYLPLIYTQAIQYNPLINVDYTEVYSHEHTGEGQSEGTSNSNSNTNGNSSGLNINSDTPQGQVNKEEILTGKYASSTSANENATVATDETKVDSTNKTNTKDIDSYTRNVKGNQGITASYQAMIMQYRDTVANYTKEIIDELNSLFMALY
jgi:hypothetical protein